MEPAALLAIAQAQAADSQQTFYILDRLAIAEQPVWASAVI
jgi:hypothetical protein